MKCFVLAGLASLALSLSSAASSSAVSLSFAESPSLAELPSFAVSPSFAALPSFAASPSPAIQAGSAVPSQKAAAGEVRARLEIEPAAAEIGEPVRWTLVVEHPSRAKFALPDWKDLPREWALVETLGVRREADASSADRTITRASWRMMSLDAGDVSVPEIKLDVEEGGEHQLVQVTTPKLAVSHALLEGEDAPRASKGFRPAPIVPSWSFRGIVSALVVLLVLIVVAFVVRKRSKKGPIVVAAATPLERLADLARRAQSEPEAAREIVFALTRTLRDAVDAFCAEPRQAAPDALWMARVENDERVPAGVRSVAQRLLADAERVKYAQESPTRFALDAVLEDARNALEVLARTPKPAPIAPAGVAEEAA